MALLSLLFCQMLRLTHRFCVFTPVLFCPLQCCSSLHSTHSDAVNITSILHVDESSSHFSLLIVFNLPAAFEPLLPDL